MEDEQIFRVILVLGFVAVFPVGLYHRLEAHAAKLRLKAAGSGCSVSRKQRAYPDDKSSGRRAG